MSCFDLDYVWLKMNGETRERKEVHFSFTQCLAKRKRGRERKGKGEKKRNEMKMGIFF